jgi:hypothetical protein
MVRDLQHRPVDRRLIGDAAKGLAPQLPGNLSDGFDPHRVAVALRDGTRPLSNETAEIGIVQVDPLVYTTIADAAADTDHIQVLLDHLAARVRRTASLDYAGDVLIVNQNQIPTDHILQSVRHYLSERAPKQDVARYMERLSIVVDTRMLDPEIVLSEAKAAKGIDPESSVTASIYTTMAGQWDLRRYNAANMDSYTWKLYQLLSGLKAVDVLGALRKQLTTEELAAQAA